MGQAQLYAQQYMAQQQAQQQAAAGAQTTAAPEPAPAPEAKKEDKVMLYEKTPQIHHIEEGRNGQYRSTLKAVMYDNINGRRKFVDVFEKGPWRRKKDEALKDQEELSLAFKY